jgi:hypothetical protein
MLIQCGGKMTCPMSPRHAAAPAAFRCAMIVNVASHGEGGAGRTARQRTSLHLTAVSPTSARHARSPTRVRMPWVQPSEATIERGLWRKQDTFVATYVRHRIRQAPSHRRAIGPRRMPAASGPPVAAPNPKQARPAREFASGWFEPRMRFRCRTPGIVASCAG